MFIFFNSKIKLNVVPDTLSRFDVHELDLDCNPPEVDVSSSEFNCDEYNKLRRRAGGLYAGYPCL